VVNLIEHFEGKGHYCLVLEIMKGGELFEQVLEKETLTEDEVHRLMIPVFDALIYCHSKGIIHRDIKPDNLLLSSKDLKTAVVKVSDFGLARTFGTDDLATTQAGTPSYIAPEIIMKKPYDHRCDYWSLAVTLFVLLSGMPPFFHEDVSSLFEIIAEGEYDFSAPVWENVSTEAKDFIGGLLKVNPDERMTVD